MHLRRRNNIVLLCMLLACCQEVDLAEYSKESTNNDNPTETSAEDVTVLGIGEGTAEHPYTVEDIRSTSPSESEEVWVIGYMVGTARTSMNNAVFSADAPNQSNILLSSDSLCSDTAICIPVELSSDKWKKELSIPTNSVHFRKCLLVKGVPSLYMRRKGLRKVSAGLWLDGFDISSVAPLDWSPIEIPF